MAIHVRNIAYWLLGGGGTGPTSAVAGRLPLGVCMMAGKVQEVAFNLASKGVVNAGTAFSVDVKKNGTSVLAAAVTITTGTVTDFTKADTNGGIVQAAPTGWGALPALSTTLANILVSEGDLFELVVTPNGTYTTAPIVAASVRVEQYIGG